jgi:hypothetical protein
MTRLLNTLGVAVAFAVAGVLASPASAADGQAGGNYRLSARVPVACWVRPTSALLARSASGGSVVEACNAPGGFTVSAQYRPLLSTERASLRYAGRFIDLARSGEQVLHRSSMATIRTVDYQFDDVELSEPLVLSLTIQPI